MSWDLQRSAQDVPIGGSLTFKALVLQRDWDAVREAMEDQVDRLHGTSLLSAKDRQWLRDEAAKDGMAL